MHKPLIPIILLQQIINHNFFTSAILTKPDLLDSGTEKNVLDIIRNKVIPLNKGYIMVKCRGQKQIDDKLSLIEATRQERDFFKHHEFFR